MKTFQKIALVSAIATASFATQAMEALDDTVLGNTTGQAGVTIDITLAANTPTTTAVKVGEIVYTDEGSANIKNVTVGTDSALTISQDIDINAAGQLVMTASAANGLKIGVGSVSLSNAAVDAVPGGAAAVDAAQQGENLITNLNLEVNLGASTTTIGANKLRTAQLTGNDVDANTIVIDSTASIELVDGSFTALGDAVSVTGLKFAAVGGGAATIKQTIYANDDGLNMIIEDIAGSLSVGAVNLGGASIGSLAITNIQLAGVTQTISGH